MRAAEASVVFYRHMVREQIALMRLRRVGARLYPSAKAALRGYLRKWREARRACRTTP
jgi:hypothetical protein